MIRQLIRLYPRRWRDRYGVGRRAAALSESRFGALTAGAVAGFLIGASIVLTFVVLDNAYADIIGRQEQKIVALANAGGGDMRTFLNQELIRMTFGLIPALTAIGAGLGHLGGRLAGPRPTRITLRR